MWKQCMYVLSALLLVGIPVLSGCTAREMYDDLRDSERDRCARMPQSQATQCFAKTAYTYDEYRNEVEQHRSTVKKQERKQEGKKEEKKMDP